MPTKTPKNPNLDNKHNPAQEEYEKLTGRYNPNHQDSQAAGNPTDPRGHDAAAGDSSDPRGPGPDDIKQQEETPASPDYSPAADDDRVGRGYTKTDKSQKAGWRKYVLNRRGAAGGGIIGAIIVAFFGFSVLQGPAELVQLSHVLQKNFAAQDEASSSRFGKLFRLASAKSFGETRLGLGQRAIYRYKIKQLKAIGIEFQTTSLDQIKSVSVKTEAFSKKYPEFRDMNIAERKAFLADRLGVPKEQIFTNSKGTIFGADGRDLDVKLSRQLVRNITGLLGKGKIQSAITNRTFAKAFDLPSLFHPLKRAVASKLKGATLTAEARRAEERRRQAELAKPAEEKAAKPIGKLRNKLGAKSLVGGALISTAALCLVRSVSDDVVEANRLAVVNPATVQALDKIAVGEQVESSQDFSLDQLGGIVNGFTDENGNTIWQASALQATAGQSPTGEDLTLGYRQAFSNDTTAQNIIDSVGSPKIPLPGGKSIDLGGAACSKVGIAIQGAAGIALAAGSIIAAIPTGGTTLALEIGKVGAGVAATAGVAYMIEHQLTDMIKTGSAVPDLLSGPLGGNLLAYGAREAGNMGARSIGGVELSDSETAQLEARVALDNQREFASKGIVGQLFDIYDHRSLAGRLIDNGSPSFTQNIANMGSVLLNFGHIFSTLPNLFIPKVQAASIYYWGFPLYGVPSSLLNDPDLANPYTNGAYVAKNILEGSKSHSYISRAKKCFGDEIKNDSGVWDVIPGNPVNPSSRDYVEARCNDISDSNWKRVIMFVTDTTTLNATNCYLGDEPSCVRIELSGGSAEDTTRTLADAGAVSGNTQQLAQQVLGNSNISLGCRHCHEDVQNTSQGQPAYGSVNLDIGILQFLIDAAGQGQVTVTSITGEGSGHSNGSNHYTGHAVDISCSGIGSQVETLNQIAAKYNGKNNGERCDQPNPYGNPPHDHYDFFN